MNSLEYYDDEFLGFDDLADHFDDAYEDDPFFDSLRGWAHRTMQRLGTSGSSGQRWLSDQGRRAWGSVGGYLQNRYQHLRTDLRTPGSDARRYLIDKGRGALGNLGGYLGERYFGPFGKVAGSAIGSSLGLLLPDQFDEDDLFLEELGALATEADTDEDAVAYVRAMIPVVIKNTPGPKHILLRNAPAMMKMARKTARVLRGSSITRPMIRLLPLIMKRSARTLQHRHAKGIAATPKSAKRIMKLHTRRIMGNSVCSRKYLHRNYALCKYLRALARRRRHHSPLYRLAV